MARIRKEGRHIKKLTTVPSFIFEGFIIVGVLHSDWLKVFDQKIPTFFVYIDEIGKLHFVSHEVVKNDS